MLDGCTYKKYLENIIREKKQQQKTYSKEYKQKK